MAEKNSETIENSDNNIMSILDQMANTVPEDYGEPPPDFGTNPESGQELEQPTSSGIQLVSVQDTDDKYLERRRKNNLAAKKSRDARKIRENQLKCKVACLENANQVLRSQLERERKQNEDLNVVINEVKAENDKLKQNRCTCQDDSIDNRVK